ncbi:MAG: hypothetical protein ACK4SX_01205 [Alcanivoracaceae bacterium]
MDLIVIIQDAISGTLATVLGGILLGGMAWFAWPLRWKIQGRVIKKLVAGDRLFNFVYNPSENLSKALSFLADGRIGEGSNENECTWRIRRGKLEILAADDKVYSRFRYDRTNGFLRHTNDPELRSISGQFLQPRFVRVVRPDV